MTLENIDKHTEKYHIGIKILLVEILHEGAWGYVAHI